MPAQFGKIYILGLTRLKADVGPNFPEVRKSYIFWVAIPSIDGYNEGKSGKRTLWA